MKAFWLPLSPLLVFLLLGEAAVRSGMVPSYLLPAPSQVLLALMTGSNDLWIAASMTLFGALIGFFISVLAGLLMGIAMSASSNLRIAFYPYTVFFQTVPIIAIAPLLVIWFGYGLPTVIASSFIVSLFPVVANTLSGLLATERNFEDLFRLYRATPWQRFWKLKIPFALPQILTGTRIGAGLAVVGAIVGEFVSGGGLGGVIDIARTQQRIDKVFAAVILAALSGLVFFIIIAAINRRLLKHWHPSMR